MRRLLLFFLFSQHLLAAQTTWFVRVSPAAPAPDGLSWQSAFHGLQDALQAAQYGDQIWIAEGSYTPLPADDRYATFVLKNGVRLYGGFAGTESTLQERNATQHPVILSGDIGTPGLKTDNCLHVLTGMGLDGQTLIDGCTISGGYSAGYVPLSPTDVCGAGVLLLSDPDVPNTRPVFRNCRFLNNEAQYGGAVYADWENPNTPGNIGQPVNPVFEHCIFEKNRAFYSGGAYYKNGHTAPSQDTLKLIGCRFSDNRALSQYGGGVYLAQPGLTHLLLRHCVFERDSAPAGGGLMYDADNQNAGYAVRLLIDSCTFIKNYALDGGALIYSEYFGDAPGHQLDCRFREVLFEGNKSIGGDGSTYSIVMDNNAQLRFDMQRCTLRQNETINTTISFISLVGGSTGSVNIRDCVFTGNFKTGSANGQAAPLVISVPGNSAPNYLQTRIDNCLFSQNGGGIISIGGNTSHVRTEVHQCTFYKNKGVVFWKSWNQGVFNPWDTTFALPSNRMHLSNNIIWEPLVSLKNTFYNNNPSGTSVYGFWAESCLFNRNKTEFNNPIGGSVMVAYSTLFATDPMFVDTLAGDLRLQDCSPAKDTSIYHYVMPDANVTTDLNGAPRVRFGRSDLGAYEIQDSCQTVATQAPPSANVAELSLWPNPAAPASAWHFSLPENSIDDGVVRVFDMAGRMVFQAAIAGQEVHTISPRLPGAGTFQVQVLVGKKQYTGRVVVQK